MKDREFCRILAENRTEHQVDVFQNCFFSLSKDKQNAVKKQYRFVRFFVNSKKNLEKFFDFADSFHPEFSLKVYKAVFDVKCLAGKIKQPTPLPLDPVAYGKMAKGILKDKHKKRYKEGLANYLRSSSGDDYKKYKKENIPLISEYLSKIRLWQRKKIGFLARKLFIA